jgi:hypothetical protein
VTLDGWNEIATHVEVLSGITRCERTVRRWASREADPLPVQKSPGGRDVVANSEMVEAWVRRMFPTEGL